MQEDQTPRQTIIKKNEKICMVGLGFVGMTMGLVLSEAGFPVVGVDKRQSVLDALKNKKPFFYEKGMVELLEKQLRVDFTFANAIPPDQSCNIYIIAVGTLVDNNNQPSFLELESAAVDIGKVLKRGDLVILRSTVPIGTTRNFVILLLEKHSCLRAINKDFFTVFAPERTIEGEAINELKRLPQIVGGYDKESVDASSHIFESFAPSVIVVDSLEEAEMVKMINNSYRDLTFAFANELVLICDHFNIDSEKVIRAANLDYKRSSVPKPSPGVGGYCLTKDPFLLAYSTMKIDGYKPLLPFASRKINAGMPKYLADKIMNFLTKTKIENRNARVGILGLAFKGNPPTSDVRFSPSLDLVNLLKREQGVEVFAHDDLVGDSVFSEAGIKRDMTIQELFEEKDCVVIMIDHLDYNNLPIIELLSHAHSPVLFFDPWKLYDSKLIERADGVYYANLGYSNFGIK